MAACVGALAGREVALCVKCGHIFIVTLYMMRGDGSWYTNYHTRKLLNLIKT